MAPHLTRPPPAAREHSAALTAKLQAKEQELQSASAELAEASAKASAEAKAAAEQHEASLSELRGELTAKADAAAGEHAAALAAATAARDEAAAKAAEAECDAAGKLERLQTERDELLQAFTALQEKERTLGAAAGRVRGLELQLDDLTTSLVRPPSAGCF
jgi:chromosome segregation ATPase